MTSKLLAVLLLRLLRAVQSQGNSSGSFNFSSFGLDPAKNSQAIIGYYARAVKDTTACFNCPNKEYFPDDPSASAPLACYNKGKSSTWGGTTGSDPSTLPFELPKKELTVEAWMKFDRTPFDENSIVIDFDMT